MGAVPRQVGEGLGHERSNGPVLFRQGSNHPTEEGVTVSGRQAVRIGPVDFELTIGVFMIVRVRVPTKFLHVLQHGRHEVEIPVQRIAGRNRVFVTYLMLHTAHRHLCRSGGPESDWLTPVLST